MGITTGQWIIAIATFGITTGAVGLCLYLFRGRLLPKAKSPAASDESGLKQFPVIPSSGLGPLAAFDSWFQQTCYFAGSNVTPTSATVMMLGSGSVLATTVFLVTYDALLTIVAGVVAILMFLFILRMARERAMSAFQEQFPSVLDLISRAVHAGESLEQALQMLTESGIAEPASTEFSRCSRQLEMGLSVPAAMASMCQRVRLLDVQILSSALSAHRESGGNLARTLDRLATVIRDRLNYRRQLRAVTGASRISVYIIAALGPVLFAWLFLFNPEYGEGLWTDTTGRLLLVYAIVSEVVGLGAVAYLMKADY